STFFPYTTLFRSHKLFFYKMIIRLFLVKLNKKVSGFNGFFCKTLLMNFFFTMSVVLTFHTYKKLERRFRIKYISCKILNKLYLSLNKTTVKHICLL